MQTTAVENDSIIRRRGVVAVIQQDQRFLVIERSQLVSAPGMYCFPGGGIEAGESEVQALTRELREELGIEVVPRRRLWHCVTRWSVSLAWWLSDMADGSSICPDPSEVAGFGWFSAQEMRSLPKMLESNHWFLQAWDAGEFTLEEI